MQQGQICIFHAQTPQSAEHQPIECTQIVWNETDFCAMQKWILWSSNLLQNMIQTRLNVDGGFNELS